MATEYLMRARKTSDSTMHYWTVLDSADTSMNASNAPTPSGDYSDVVVAAKRAVRAGLFRESLTSQVDGSNSTFTTGSSYYTGTLRVYWNGQVQSLSDITELSSSTFSIGLTPESGDAIEVAYRPA